MENKIITTTALGSSNYINTNCWLVKSSKVPVFARCLYCKLRFRECLTVQFLVLSLSSLILTFIMIFLLTKLSLDFLILVTFIPMIILLLVCGYFFNRNTDRIASQNFELEELNKEKSNFLSIASHQLKNPLTVAKGNASLLLKDKSLNNNLKTTVQDIYDSSTTALNLIKDFLNISKIDTLEEGMVFEFHDIVVLLKEIYNDYRLRFKEKAVNFKLTDETRNLTKICFDLDNIEVVIKNLLDNALIYTLQEGSVNLVISNDEQWVYISVRDTGIGISKDEQEKIGSKYFRAENAKVLNSSGSGLGLFLAKYIITKHGGNLWFKSIVDKGSQFFISLPIVPRVECNKNQR